MALQVVLLAVAAAALVSRGNDWSVLAWIVTAQTVVLAGRLSRSGAARLAYWQARLGTTVFTCAGLITTMRLDGPAQGPTSTTLVLFTMSFACEAVAVSVALRPVARLRQTRLALYGAGGGYALMHLAIPPMWYQAHFASSGHQIRSFTLVLLVIAAMLTCVGMTNGARVGRRLARPADVRLGLAGVVITVYLLLIAAVRPEPFSEFLLMAWVIGYFLTAVVANHPTHRLLGADPVPRDSHRSCALPTFFLLTFAIQASATWWLIGRHASATTTVVTVLVGAQVAAIVALVVAVLERSDWRAGTSDLGALHRDVPSGVVFGQVRPHYQPIVSTENLRVVGFEALARWDHPRLGELTASEFMPAVTRAGLHSVLDVQMIRAVASDKASLVKSLDTDEPLITVNLSAQTLQQPTFADTLLRILDVEHLDPDGLTIEVSEAPVECDWNVVAANLRKLQDRGVWIALDDFGVGISNLARLNTLDPDVVKLDHSIVHAGMHSARGREVARAAVTAARSAGSLVVAEGVEDELWRRELGTLGVHYLQGYAFGSAAPLADHLAAGTPARPI